MKTCLHLLVAFALSLPMAGAMAQNLVVNGDFEAGNTGFSNDYLYAPLDMVSAGTYCVVANPASVHSSWSSFGDHTTGAGLMLVANGDTSPTNVVWRQTVSVSTNTGYLFSGWAASAFPEYPGSFFLYVNGTQIGSSVNLPWVTGLWQNYSAVWTSGNSTDACLEVRVLSTSYYGNDFVLDDLSFRRLSELACPDLAIKRTFPDEAVVLTWTSATNQLYQVQWTSALDASQWFSLGAPVPGTGAAVSVTNTISESGQRFYRLLSVD